MVTKLTTKGKKKGKKLTMALLAAVHTRIAYVYALAGTINEVFFT